MKKGIKAAAHLHERVPAGWYFKSLKVNPTKWYWYPQWAWHNLRFMNVAGLVEPTGGVVLDVGCADGVFTKVVLDKSKAERVVGVDVLKDSIDWAEKHWKKEKRMEFMVADGHKLPFKGAAFNAAFALEVLEHVADPGKVLKEIFRVLKPGGYAVFLVPSDSFLFKTLWYNFWTKTRGSVWDDTHIQSYTDNNLIKLAKKAGFRIEKNKKFILGMLQVVKVRKNK